jgi:hypothetical protein
MKNELCEYLLDGIPITWQDVIKEAFHYAELNKNDAFSMQTIKLLMKSWKTGRSFPCTLWKLSATLSWKTG